MWYKEVEVVETHALLPLPFQWQPGKPEGGEEIPVL